MAGPGFDPVAFHARFRPDRTACTDLATGEALTFTAFSDRATAAAWRLARLFGRRRGERVVVVSRNSLLLAIISTACERAGAIFAPLNWRLTAMEISGLLADAQPAIVIAEPEFAPAVREAISLWGGETALAAPTDIAGGDAAPVKPVELEPAGANDPCIILYTSGTTGKPKGVIITRENGFWQSMNFASVANVEAGSVLLCDSPMFHTVGLVAVTRTALQQGASVLISDRFLPATTVARLADPKLAITHYFVVPQMVEALMREPDFAKADLSRLKALFSGGGPLPQSLIEACADRGLVLVNGYGMSETGTSAHMPLNTKHIKSNSRSVGFNAPYIEVRLVDADGQTAAEGASGEIWMRGPSVSPGYWRQEEATQASRHDDWFRSGDVGMHQPDGSLLIVDRIKDMYISGGENVYPAEVEAVLKQVDGVIDAAVIGVPDARWGEVGAAYIEATIAEDRLEPMLREHCAARLARFKQPASYSILSALPRTGSGKVMKGKLREAAKPTPVRKTESESQA